MDAQSAEVASFVLETARIGGLLAVAPLPWRDAPSRVRGTFAVVLAFVAHGGANRLPELLDTTGKVLFAVPFELLVGAAMGMVVRLAMSAAEVGADAISPMLGLGIAAVFDPQTGQQDAILSRILTLVATFVAVLLGLHRVVLGSLIASFRVLPPGSAVDPSLAAIPLVKMSAAALLMGARIALPVVAVLLLTQLALAFISRAAPAMQIFSVGFAVSLAVGGVVFLVALPDMAREIASDLSHVGTRMEAVVVAMTGGG